MLNEDGVGAVATIDAESFATKINDLDDVQKTNITDTDIHDNIIQSASDTEVMLRAGFAATSGANPAQKRPIEIAFTDAQVDKNNLNSEQEIKSKQGNNAEEEANFSTKRNRRTASLLLGTGASFAHPRIGREYQTALPEFLGNRPSTISASSLSPVQSKPQQTELSDVVEKGIQTQAQQAAKEQ